MIIRDITHCPLLLITQLLRVQQGEVGGNQGQRPGVDIFHKAQMSCKEIYFEKLEFWIVSSIKHTLQLFSVHAGEIVHLKKITK